MVAETVKRHPLIYWAQRDNVLFLTVEVEDMKIEKLVCEGNKFHIRFDIHLRINYSHPRLVAQAPKTRPMKPIWNCMVPSMEVNDVKLQLLVMLNWSFQKRMLIGKPSFVLFNC
jgi:hypothetical protein